jgi:protein-S-isoprenylcysteine O-methyltransferase Ste14
MTSEMNREAQEPESKSTGSLKLPTAALENVVVMKIAPAPPHFIRSLAMRFAEAAIFLIAVIGAIALGMGITDYFAEHRYVLAYLVAYAGFRCSDLLIREDTDDLSARDELVRRISVQLPLLAMFAAAPFERTFIYGGPPPAWLSALGLLLELLGMWLALGSRMQLGYFSSMRSAENPPLVKRGVYRYVRHPVYAGTFLVTLAWPLVYGAPATAFVTFIIGSIYCYRRMKAEDAAMLEQFGEQYEDYMRETDALIPTIW